ncbi:MAG: hypothetical protein RL210_590 [Pseudomonadota bacterium]|jgi:YidC/Oxa1 family membrane protein insertase
MDSKRLIVFMILSMSIVFLWQEWETRRHPPQSVSTQTATPAKAATGQAAPAAAAASDNNAKLQNGERLRVTTDMLVAEIDANGGDIRYLALRKHGAFGDPKQPLVLFESSAEKTYVAQAGLLENSAAGLPTHRTLYTLPASAMQLGEGKDQLQVRLEANSASGVKVARIYTFKRGSYLIDTRFEVSNGSAQAISPSAYFRLLRDSHAPDGDSYMVATFTGAAQYTAQNKYQKISFDDLAKGDAKYTKACDNGWIGIVQHYFVAAWLPENTAAPAEECGKQSDRQFELKKQGELNSVAVIRTMGNIAPGQTANIDMPLFAGPQESAAFKTLGNRGDGLEHTKDYGMLTVLAAPMFALLEWMHKLTGNWGWAIILLTIVIKAALYPLSAASYRSMAQMKALAPRLERLKEQHGDDRQKFHQAMMELYKTEKVNPLGGCLPMLLQIPIFIALYWSLLGAVELRQAPWIMWINDLSQPDPFYVLPVILAGLMFAQTFLNPPPTDPMQAKMMKIMPLAFSVMFFFFPAGLVVYWVVNSALSMLQQWFNMKQFDHDKKTHIGSPAKK